eukprot:15273946-Alexandrium_andersonii.AAC.1
MESDHGGGPFKRPVGSHAWPAPNAYPGWRISPSALRFLVAWARALAVSDGDIDQEIIQLGKSDFP